MKSTFFACMISLCMTALPVTQAVADPMPLPGQPEDRWRYSLGVYAFTPLRTRGVSTVGGRSVDVDLNLRDVLDLLDFAAAGKFEAWNGDFGLVLDANYVSIGADGPFPAPAGATYAVNTRQKWLGILAAYRVYDGTYGANNQRFTFDLQGGARYNSLRQTVKLYVPGPGAMTCKLVPTLALIIARGSGPRSSLAIAISVWITAPPCPAVRLPMT